MIDLKMMSHIRVWAKTPISSNNNPTV